MLFKRMALLGLLGVALAACGNLADRWYGPADTDLTEAYRFEGRYVYLALAADAYVSHPEAKPDVASILCVLDARAYGAVTTASDTLVTGGDKVTAGLVTAGVALRNLSLSVLDDFSLSATVEDVGKRSVVLATIAVDAVVRMRTFRQGFLEPQLQAFSEAGMAPTEEDFAVLRGKAGRLHEAVQAGCG